MRLKRLKIHGFKSFADVSTIDFIDGITAVVGPNGCGKSNIADAFRWVLGEQSAKSLRGRSMPDVIFAGTTTRKPLNYAEVSLTLSDVNGQLPIDYDEVTVTRRLHRSGESEYFINAHPVRYREIQSLFMDSGIGRSAFSIFEQGKIDQVINLSPFERRYLFEEAAGILRFLQRKKEALRKLEETEQNMARLEDLQREVARQVEVLGRQAEEARHYKAKKNELDALQTAVLCARWSWYDLQLRQLEEREKGKMEAVAASQAALQEGQTLYRQYREALVQAEHRLGLQRQEIVKVQTTIEHTVGSQRKQRERLDEASIAQQKREKELVALLAERSARREEVEACEERLEDAKERQAEAEEKLTQRRSQLATYEERLTALWQQQQSMQHEQLKLVQAEAKVEGDLNQSLALLNAAQQRLTTLEVEREGVRQRLADLETLTSEREGNLQTAAEKVIIAKERLESLVAATEELQHKASSKEQELQSVDKQLTEQQARHRLLEQLRSSGEGLGAGTKRLLEESTKEHSPLCGKLKPLYELMLPKAGSEHRVAHALHHYTDTLVVETISDLKFVLAFAAQEKLQGFALLSMEMVSDKREEALPGVRYLNQECDGKAGQHLLKDMIVEESLDHAIAFASKHAIIICSSDGLTIDLRKVISKADTGTRNVFMREAELRSLETQIEALSTERDRLQLERQGVAERLAAVDYERNEVREQLRRDEVQNMEANYAWQQALNDLEKARLDKQRIEQAAANAMQSSQQLRESMEGLQKQLEEARNSAIEGQERHYQIEQDTEQLQTLLKADKQSLQADEAAYERLADEARRLSHTLSLLAVKDHESQIQEKRLEADIKQAKELQEKLQGEEQDHGVNLEAIEKRLERLLEAQQQTEDEVILGRQKVEQQEQAAETESNRLKRREKELYEVGIQKTQQQTMLQAFAAELADSHNIDVEAQKDSLPELDESLPEAEQRLKTLKDEVEHGANVNMTSIEEYDAQKERSESLALQLHDLHVSQQELQQIIGDLDDESRRLFTDTFKVIRTKFQEIFQILFRGGEADLCLTDENDVLAAGIEIVAKPPGKQMRSIHLMSGGEKCLTALALLFALFEVKPAPFCLLDEIDAPLDDSNVGRFAAMLKHFIDRCQFIVITHNKCTMAVADVLVGVSMQEKGVSKVLTFDFARHEMDMVSKEAAIPAKK